MAQNFSTGKSIRLIQKLNPTDVTLLADVDVGTTTGGRLYFQNDNQVEWVSYTTIAASGSYFLYSGLIRGLSQTTDPAAAGTGLTWLANQKGILVIMHDQLWNRQKPEALTFATTAARDTALGADGGGGAIPYFGVYVTATGLYYNWNIGTNQWEAVDTGTATPNATTTAAGKVEIATSAESIAGTDTGGTGAFLSVLPNDIAKNIQSGTFISGTAAGTNTYTTSLTPSLTAYAKSLYLITFTNGNTGASTLNIDSLGAKNIYTFEGNAVISGDISAGGAYLLYYDGTQFRFIKTVSANDTRSGIVEKATDAECSTKTDDVRYTSPAGVQKGIGNTVGTPSSGVIGTNYQASTNGIVVCYYGGTSIGPADVICYTDSSNPPTTIVTRNQGMNAASSMAGATFVVKKGDYWRVDGTGTGASVGAINFYPFGT